MYAFTLASAFFGAFAAAATEPRDFCAEQVQIKDFKLFWDPSNKTTIGLDSIDSLTLTIVGIDGEEIECDGVDNCESTEYNFDLIKGTDRQFAVVVYNNGYTVPGGDEYEDEGGSYGQADMPAYCFNTSDRKEVCTSRDVAITLN